MLSTVGLELMNAISPELNWKNVRKGRRTRKSIARSLNGVAKVNNSSPKRVGDFSGSDSDKCGETVVGQQTFDRADHVPIKKRRNLLQSPSSLLSEDRDQLSYPSHSSGQRYLRWQLRGIDVSSTAKFGKRFDYESLSERTKGEYFSSVDFTGIELLAAAASMEDDADNACKEALVVEDSSMPKSFDAFSCATLSEPGLKCHESENSLSNATVHEANAKCSLVSEKGAAASQSSSGSVKDETTPECVSLKVERIHWDLNTVMDAWGEPDESISGNISRGVTDFDMPDKTCTDLPNLLKSANSCFPSAARETSDQVTEEYANEDISNHVLNGDADVITSNQVINTDAILDHKLHSSSSMLTSEENKNTISVSVSIMQDEDCLINENECDRATTSNEVQTGTQDVIAHEVEATDSTFHTCHDSGASQDNHDHVVDGDDRSRFPEGYDSPFEDGELRGSFLYSWEKNKLEKEYVDYESDGRNGEDSDTADCLGSEIVEGSFEGSQSTGMKNLMMKRSQEDNGSKNGAVKHSLRKHFIKVNSENNEICAKKNSNGGSDTTVEQYMINENDDGVKKRHLTNQRDAFNGKILMREYESRMAVGKIQSRIKGRPYMGATNEVDERSVRQCRSRHIVGSYSHERDISAEKYVGRFRPATHESERDGIDQWTNWGSKRRYNPSYHENTRPGTGDSADKCSGLEMHDQRQTTNYHRPLVRRRSPLGTDDCFDMRRRMQLTQGINSYQNRGYNPQNADRDFGDDFAPMPNRLTHMPLTRTRTRSITRTRFKEHNFCSRRYSRSPERTRVGFPKPSFESDYRDGYLSPPRSPFSPPRNFRCVDNHNFEDNHLRHRRSPPVRVFRRSQKFDSAGFSSRLKSDEYFRPMSRPRRYGFVPSNVRDCKFDNYEDRKHENIGEMMHQVRHSDDFGTSYLNKGRRIRDDLQ